ncbi:MAG: TonB-dependent receptor [Gammaproteobacteria bacterium]|nr:TonB-dependent receptor [Gammaproteobacteria bacterium]
MSYGTNIGFAHVIISVITLGMTQTAWSAQSGGVIEEVIVTAEKRTSNAQDTPIALTAYDSEELAIRGINDISDLQFSVPNLIVSPNSQSPVTYAYIRGIGSDQLVAGFDPGVSYHIDGVYIGQPSSMPGDLWDMERVEVLRGPQGTLYGRNTTGGSINVITQDPSEEFEALMDVTAGNYDDVRVRGVVNGKITDGISGRIAAIDQQNDGYQDNLYNSQHTGDVTDYSSIRGKLKFDLGDSADLVLTAQRFQNYGNQSQKRREPFDSIPVYAGAIPNPSDPHKVAKDYHEKLQLKNTFLSARLTWDLELGALGPATLVAVSGYVNNNWYQNADIDQSSNPIQYQTWSMDTNQFTQEIRILSAGEGPWEWLAGVFYFNENLDSDYLFDDVSPFGFTFYNGGSLDSESYAAFGQLGYDFRDGGHPFKVSAGLRYTSDEKKIDEYQQIPAFGVDLSGKDSDSWDQYTGQVDFNYFFRDDIMAYITLSHGYKGGGYSLGQFDNYDPEKMDAIESGVKSQFWEGRAQLNVAAFYDKYKDLQVNFLEFTSFTTDNAAKATIKGVELEFLILPVDDLSIGVNATWLSAEFDDYQFTPTIDLSGETLNRAPKYTTQLFAQYDWSLGKNGVVTARADYYWQDKVYYRVQNIARHEADSFFTADARLMWTSPADRWVVDAYVKNLTDEKNLRNLTVSDGLSTGDNSFVSYYPPRTYGVRVGWRTGG